MNVIEMTMSVLTNQKKADMSDMTESNFRTQIINIFLVGHNYFSLYYYYFSYVLLTEGPPLIHLIIF
jgi:hypothetical protein